MNGRQVFQHTLVAALTVLGLLLLWRLAAVVLVLVGAVIFASAIRPVVAWLVARGIPRALAIATVYVAVLGSIGGLLAFSLPLVVDTVGRLLADRGIVARLALRANETLDRLGYGALGIDLIGEVNREWNAFVDALGRPDNEGATPLRTGALAAGQLGIGLVMATYWLTARDRMQGYLLTLTPIRRRARVQAIFDDVERTLGEYVRGTAVLMVAIGASAFVGLLALGVPNALPLAVVAGLLEAVPMVGGTIGAVPAVLAAFAHSPATGLLTVALFTAIQLIENSVLVPRVMSRSVGIDPLLVILAIAAGSLLNGIVGVLMAIPVVGAIQVIFRHGLLDPMAQEASQRTVERGIPVFRHGDAEPGDPPAAGESAGPRP